MMVNRSPIGATERPITESPIIAMTPAELDQRLSALASQEISFTFGLHLGDGGEWTDASLAEQCLHVFVKYPESRCMQITLLAAAFLLHTDKREFANATISGMDFQKMDLSSVLAVVRHHRDLTRGPPTQSSGFIQSAAFEFLKNYNSRLSAAPLRLLKHLIKFQEDSSARAFDIFGMISQDLVGLSTSFIAHFLDDRGVMATTAAKLWSNWWHHMTADRAPWHRCLTPQSRQAVHFKRDFTFCAATCPVKLTRNHKFDDHRCASILRDTGNRLSLAKKLARTSELSLFDIVEIPERAKSNESYAVSRCLVELKCEFVRCEKITLGTFALLDYAIVLSKTSEAKTTVIRLDSIACVFLRTRFHHPTAIEIFLVTGKTYFVNFPNVNALPVIRCFKSLELPKLQFLQLSDFKTACAQTNYTDEWISRRLSTFEYLMKLNILSGRSFHDPCQYPFLPWVITNYTSDKLDLEDPANFRDLSLPMGATNPERLAELKSKISEFHSLGLKTYLYGSGHVCALSLFLWMIRQEPFTSLHIELQGGRFDHAARQFTSIEVSFRNSTSNANDFRELIPEFYSAPEFLTNSEGFDLGQVNGRSIDEVLLPPWARTPFEFVYIMRKALESDLVSQSIHHWIDLIWGFKQHGEAAIAADNVYMEEMYHNIWTDENLRDPAVREDIEAVLCHVGQIPPQLFERPHPHRNGKTIANALTQSFSVALNLAKVLGAVIILDNARTVKVTGIDETGLILVSQFDITEILRRSSCSAAIRPENVLCMKATKPFVNNRPIAVVHGRDFLYVKDIDLHCVSVLTGTDSIVHRAQTAIVCFAFDGERIAIGDEDAFVKVYEFSDLQQPKFVIPSFANAVQCCAISLDFHAIVCGTKDGYLLFCSLTNGAVIRAIQVEMGSPVSILITKGWGFVLVEFTRIHRNGLTHHLALYSINGDFIRSCNLNNAITAWIAVKTSDGFDFVVLGDEDGNLHYFEAFYLELGPPFPGEKERAVALGFIEPSGIVIAVTQDGTLLFRPVK
jgi:hypothetical protein